MAEIRPAWHKRPNRYDASRVFQGVQKDEETAKNAKRVHMGKVHSLPF
jgi:hypothetical protein